VLAGSNKRLGVGGAVDRMQICEVQMKCRSSSCRRGEAIVEGEDDGGKRIKIESVWTLDPNLGKVLRLTYHSLRHQAERLHRGAASVEVEDHAIIFLSSFKFPSHDTAMNTVSCLFHIG
jgi:hypothetical protein